MVKTCFCQLTVSIIRLTVRKVKVGRGDSKSLSHITLTCPIIQIPISLCLLRQGRARRSEVGQCVQLEFYGCSLHGTHEGVCFPVSAHRCQEPLEALTTIQQKKEEERLLDGSWKSTADT